MPPIVTPLLQNPVVAKGCNCIRSRCLKGYCECFAAARSCVRLCSCVSCANVYGARPDQPGRDAACLHPVPSAPVPAVKLTKLSQSKPKPGPRSARQQSARSRLQDDTQSRDEAPLKQQGTQYEQAQARDGLLAKRQGLDSLVAAAAAVEGDECAPAAPAMHSITQVHPLAHQLCSPAWDCLLPAAPLQAWRDAAGLHPAGAGSTASAAVTHLRLALPEEEAQAQPRVCYLLPAGTLLDSRISYTVTSGTVTGLSDLPQPFRSASEQGFRPTRTDLRPTAQPLVGLPPPPAADAEQVPEQATQDVNAHGRQRGAASATTSEDSKASASQLAAVKQAAPAPVDDVALLCPDGSSIAFSKHHSAVEAEQDVIAGGCSDQLVRTTNTWLQTAAFMAMPLASLVHSRRLAMGGHRVAAARADCDF
jgi:Tesmin/TSO1-like CXC domain, cysteine-rich domain